MLLKHERAELNTISVVYVMIVLGTNVIPKDQSRGFTVKVIYTYSKPNNDSKVKPL